MKNQMYPKKNWKIRIKASLTKNKLFISKILKKILLVEMILFLFPIMYIIFIIIFGGGYPDLSYMMFLTIVIPMVLMAPIGLSLFLWKGVLKKFYIRATNFLCFDFDRINMNEQDNRWPILYFIFSGLYFFIFSIYFYFAGFKNIGQLILLSWFGLMFLRLLHFIFTPTTCLKIGRLLFSTFIPFGILLEIGLIFIKHVKILWIEFSIYAFFSISFLISVLATEILIGIVRDIIKKFIRKKHKLPSITSIKIWL
jgi:hypothetical protein